MALGNEVNKSTMDRTSAQAAMSIRDAFDKVKVLADWLSDHPSTTTAPTDGTSPVTTDPLVAEFGYTDDEAYALRVYFTTLEQVFTANQVTFDIGRKMTGLA